MPFRVPARLTVLQTFKYSFADPAKAPLAKALNFNPFMIRSGLISHSATTLRKIVMLAHPNDLAPPFMGSLREFSALTELRTNHSCLVGEDFYRPTLSQILPYSLRRLVLDGQKRSMLNEVNVDPIDFAVRAAVDAEAGWGLPRTWPIEELVFTGYEEFVKDYLMTSAEEVSLVVKFLTGDELDQTSLASSH
ncbi:hypothetical protein HO133_009546 [Letharia lupina]|uniref:Uncharacterized protein n=1 Tax=Letharia lupina TaxID=560253 RepID=A0A8H6FEV7_9LECA|nr:uncharacterized protein HO133_009546 [Letharia lupina]KAF6225546.1 hypothetical protein HO133_009546 [Letharia lupina]